MQQIVACVAAEPWDETDLFNVLRRAYPYRNLTRALFDDAVKLLSEGIESSRGRYGAYLLRDGVHGQLHPRRGSRSIAISNGGAIHGHRPIQRDPATGRRTNCHARRAFRGRLRPRRCRPARQYQLAHSARRSCRPRPGRRCPRRATHHALLVRGSPHCAPQSSRDGVSDLREQISARTLSCLARSCPPHSPRSRRLHSVAQRRVWRLRLGRTSADRVYRRRPRCPWSRSLQDHHHRRALLRRRRRPATHPARTFRRSHQQGLGARAAQALLPRLQLRTAGRRDGQRHQYLARRAAQLPALRRLPLPHRAHREGTPRAGRHRRARLQDSLALGCQPLAAAAAHVQRQAHRAADPAHPV